MDDYYEPLKSRNAVELLSSIEYQLAIRIPDAKENHRRDNLRCVLNGHISIIEMVHLREWTFEQYRLTYPRACKSLLMTIQQAAEEFKVNLGV